MRGVCLILLAALLSNGFVALAAPQANAQPPPVGGEPPLTDAEGDARWYSTADVDGSARQLCSLAGEASQRVCSKAPAAPDAGGLPAPAVLDIIAADLRVDGDFVVAELVLASVTDPIAPLGEGDERSFYNLDWMDGNETVGGFGVSAYYVNGTSQFDWWFYRQDERCARVSQCYFEPVGEIVPGTPGVIRWRLPHTALPTDTPKSVELAAASFHTTWGAMSATPAGYDYSIAERDQRLRGSTPGAHNALTDVAGPGRSIPLGPPPSWDPARDRVAGHDDPSGDLPADRPDLDILAMSISEDEKTFTVSTMVTRVDELPVDHIFVVNLYLTTGASVTAGYLVANGARAPFGGLCDGECGTAPEVPFSQPARVDVTPGAPGYVNITFPRRDLGNPGYGDSFNQVFVAALLPDAAQQEQTPGGEVRLRRYNTLLGDFAWDAAPWWFVLGANRQPPQRDDAVVVADAVGDFPTTITGATLVADLAPFDIVSLRATSTTPGVFRIELGIDDLSNVEPPQGYDAVFYGVAFATEQGAVMAGYYDEPGTQKRQFFCAPDTAILTRPAADPQKVIWQPIEGLLSVLRNRGQGVAGSATPGSIVFLVPSSCLGLEPEADLVAEAFGAATFLFSKTGEMEAIDDARSEGPVVVHATAVAAKPWYAAPFGIDEFWNIIGIVGAVVVSGAGFLAVQKKRGALRRYLREIDDVLHAHAASARDRERALLSIAERLKQDLLKNRILESHFVIVERRLDQHLGKLRVQALADAFGDVPHRVLLKLQELLADGVMDPEDWRLFQTQLDAESHLTTEARRAILARVEAWVATG